MLGKQSLFVLRIIWKQASPFRG